MNFKLTLITSFVLLLVIACRHSDPPIQQGLTTHPEKRTSISNIANIDTTEVEQLIAKAGNLAMANYVDSAMPILTEALSRGQQIGYPEGVARALYALGFCYSSKKNYKQARVLLYSALYYLSVSKNKNKIRLIKICNAIGENFYHTNQYDSALYFFYRSLRVLQKTKPIDTPLLQQVYINIAACIEPMDQENNNRAIKYAQKARALATTYKKDIVSLALICSNLAKLHYKSDIDSTIWYFNLALQYSQQLQCKKCMSISYSDIASAYLEKKEIDYAAQYLDSALNTDRTTTDNNARIVTTQGDIYHFRGLLKQAITYYLKALKLSEIKSHTSETRQKMVLYSKLALLYDSIGEGHLAYQYQVKYMRIKDSLLDEGRLNAVNQLEAKFRSSEKDAELAIKDRDILKKQAQNQSKIATIWIISLCLLLLFSTLVFLRYRQTFKIRRLLQQKELDILKATMDGEEGERLRVGQELHDGVSGLLSAIKMNLVTLRINWKELPKDRNFMTTLKLADEAANELRKTAHNLVAFSLVDNGITQAIMEFCERINVSSYLPIAVEESGVSQRLDPAKELVIFRIIQELVHNILKHSNATQGAVWFSWQHQLLLVTVEDNGVGMTEAEQKGGIGMDNIRKRVKALNGTIEINDIAGEGTSIYLEFPVSY